MKNNSLRYPTACGGELHLCYIWIGEFKVIDLQLIDIVNYENFYRNVDL